MFKKTFFLFMVTFLCVSASYALDAKTIWYIERDADGNTPGDASLIPLERYALNATSVAVIVTSPTYTNDRGGATPIPVQQSVMVYGVMLSSEGVSTDYVVLRDSSTASSSLTAQLVIPALWKDTTKPIPTYYSFNPPLKVINGLSAFLGPAGSAKTTYATIFYRNSKRK